MATVQSILRTSAGQIGNAAYGVCYNFDGEENFDSLAGAEINTAAELPNEFQNLTSLAHKYVVFHPPDHMEVLRRLQELELLQPTSKNGKVATYAWRRFALEIRRDSHSRYAPITTSTEKQKTGYQPGTPEFVKNWLCVKSYSP